MSPRWPDVVWDAAILRGLDLRSRAELEAAGRLRRLPRDEVIYRPGEPADSIFVVAEGSVALSATRRGEAEATIIRRATTGASFGEEATVFEFASRAMEARSERTCVLAEVPLAVLRRALARSGGADIAARLERTLRRTATQDLLRTTSFTRDLPDRDLEILLDAAEHVKKGRGEYVFREGDPATFAYLVAEGLLQIQTDDDGRPRVEAYLSRGDLFGEAELEEGAPRYAAVVAGGPTWLVALPRASFLEVRKQRALETRLRIERPSARVGGPEDGGAKGAAARNTTAHVFRDLYRLRVARSLLVIDQNACVRCGHCAFSCATVHEDGISRLVRRGDTMVVRNGGDPAPLLVPNSCQHCKNPSCMIDCPTGAIARDARGEVFIREDLCTGCGNCAKGCPWDNIQMAERATRSTARRGSTGSSADAGHATFPEVAVKCDLCSSRAGGPACVASCPTTAIARIDPNEVLVELGASRAARPIPPRPLVWPWLLGACGCAGGLAVAPLSAWTSGWLVVSLVVILVCYAGLKRFPAIFARAGSIAAPAYVAHLVAGILAIGATTAHVAGRGAGRGAAALLVLFGVAVLTGLFGAAAYRLLPKVLSRIEREVVLPEELLHRRRELEDAIFSKLSGRSEVVKALYARVLGAYQRSVAGPLLLVSSGRTQRDERARLLGAIAALLGGKKSERLAGLDDLVRLVVEHRAVRAQRLLTMLLRGWLAIHVGATSTSLLLLCVHVALVSRAR